MPGLEVDILLGGVDVKRDQLVATIKKLVPPEQLERLANGVISHVVIHFGSDAQLDLSFDITDIVHRIHDLALRRARARRDPGEAGRVLRRVRGGARQADRRVAGRGSASRRDPARTDPAGAARGRGRAPAPPRARSTRPIRTSDIIAAIRASIDADDVSRHQGRGRLAAGGLIAQSIDKLTHNAYVRQVDEADGPHYWFGPGDEVTAKVDRKLEKVRQLNHAAAVGRIVTAILFVLGLVVFVVLHRRERRAALAWSGALAAGALAFVGWYAVRAVAERQLADVAASKALPGSFRAILEDLFRISVADFTPTFWIPAVACAVLGGILLAAAAMSSHRLMR